jgi:hypothetical protein
VSGPRILERGDGERHVKALRRSGVCPRMNETGFEFFTVCGSDVPTSWDQMTAPVGHDKRRERRNFLNQE